MRALASGSSHLHTRSTGRRIVAGIIHECISPEPWIQKRVNRYGLSFFYGNSRVRSRPVGLPGVEVFSAPQFSMPAPGAASHEL